MVVVRTFCVLVGLALAGLQARAQSPEDKDDAWREDPYTKADPEAMARAGYVSFGPFLFAGKQETNQIDHLLGKDLRLLWVETAHFKIGCCLPPYTVGRSDRKEKAKIHAELKRLKEKLPRIDARAAKLDRWTRLHLFAQRAEDFYAEMSRRLGVQDSDFPIDAQAAERPGARGLGPYLGQPEKYAILLVDKASTFGTYWRTYVGDDPGTSMRWNFVDKHCLFYGSAIEHSEGSHRTDTAAHCHLVANLAHNLLDGYCFYTHQLPAWWSEGLAHWFVREIDPRFTLAGAGRVYAIDPKRAWTWATRVFKRVKQDHYPAAAEAFAWDDPMKMTLVEHMMAWSRVDFALSLGDDGCAKYVLEMKRIPRTGPVPSREEVFAHQARAMREAWNLDAEAFDAAWRKYVLAKYRRRKD